MEQLKRADRSGAVRNSKFQPGPWDTLLRGIPRERVRRGTTLFWQGHIAQSAVILRTGLVKLMYSFSDGRSAIVGIRGRNTVLGSAAIVNRAPQNLTIVSLLDSEIWRIQAGDFAFKLREPGEFTWQIHAAHTKEIQREFEHAAELACLSAQERMERFFGLLGLEAQPKAGGEVELPLRHWELAQLLAITPPYMSRLMHDLSRQGRLRRAGARTLITLMSQ